MKKINEAKIKDPFFVPKKFKQLHKAQENFLNNIKLAREGYIFR